MRNWQQKGFWLTGSLALASLLVIGATAAEPIDLETGFHAPPDATKPWCYWYWINDNISREGITRDLEAMARVGIGEAFIGNVDLEGEPRGKHPVLSDSWWKLVEHAVREGGRTGVNIGLFNCPGWSQSGGPWVQPDQAMRFVATREMRLTGPQKYHGALPSADEAFQDIAVLAFPAPAADKDAVSAHAPNVTCSVAIDNPIRMVDADLDTSCEIPARAPNAGPMTIDITMSKPFTARSLVLHTVAKPIRFDCQLQVAQDDGAFRTVRSFTLDRSNPGITVGPVPFGPVAVRFPATTATHFRLVLTNIGGSSGIAEIELTGAARLERFIEKQLAKMHQVPLPKWDTYLWPRQPAIDSPTLAVKPERVVNISDRVDADGTLQWDVPEGQWIVLRTGMMPTNVTNNPTSPQGQGPEIDKMSRAAVKAHFNAYVGKLLERIPADQRTALRHVVADSYETGSENWTDGMAKIFEDRYGYDPTVWLPVINGRIVGTADQSDRFLWDLRRLVADLVAQNYVGGLRDQCQNNGLRMWLENYGHWGFPAEFLQYGGQSHEIGGEFWNTGDLGSIECRAAASAAHIYGMPVVHCEAFTTGGPLWEEHPASIKRRGDWAFCEGMNHFVLHVYVHQPWENRWPGMNAWFGTEFNRHNTWFEQSRVWIDYLRRCFFMLQQGQYVADVCYFIGEDTPKMCGIHKPDLPTGYAFDDVNAEIIQEQMQVKNGRFVLPSGMSYRLLVLPKLDTMRPELLRKIRDLVAAGGAVLGPPPSRSPSMQNFPACDKDVSQIANELWQGCDGQESHHVRFGRGHVFRNADLTSVLEQLQVSPDVAGINPDEVLWIHRASEGLDIYFISNQRDRSVSLTPDFRVTDRVPELWYPDRDRIVRTARFKRTDQGTRVPLELGPHGSAFVVFREPVEGQQAVVAVTKDGHDETMQIARIGNGHLGAEIRETGQYQLQLQDGQVRDFHVRSLSPSIELSGPWQVTFPAGVDAGQDVEFAKLTSWTKHSDATIQYFSGTAIYRREFEMPADFRHRGRRWLLDLGRVEVIAEVTINGKDVGQRWNSPFTLDVTRFLQPGRNRVQIKVTNVWRNRLLARAKFPNGFPKRDDSGDSSACKPQQELWTSVETKLRPDQPLSPSGLLGPVTIRPLQLVRIPQS